MISLFLTLVLTAYIFIGASIGASTVQSAFGPVSSLGTLGLLKSTLIGDIVAGIISVSGSTS
ncbi:MAG: hypothetical protein ACQEQM_01445 [Thermoplasmatota archaeon]